MLSYLMLLLCIIATTAITISFVTGVSNSIVNKKYYWVFTNAIIAFFAATALIEYLKLLPHIENFKSDFKDHLIIVGGFVSATALLARPWYFNEVEIKPGKIKEIFQDDKMIRIENAVSCAVFTLLSIQIPYLLFMAGLNLYLVLRKSNKDFLGSSAMLVCGCGVLILSGNMGAYVAGILAFAGALQAINGYWLGTEYQLQRSSNL